MMITSLTSSIFDLGRSFDVELLGNGTFRKASGLYVHLCWPLEKPQSNV